MEGFSLESSGHWVYGMTVEGRLTCQQNAGFRNVEDGLRKPCSYGDAQADSRMS